MKLEKQTIDYRHQIWTNDQRNIADIRMSVIQILSYAQAFFFPSH